MYAFISDFFTKWITFFCSSFSQDRMIFQIAKKQQEIKYLFIASANLQGGITQFWNV